jgi:hypothetical protein
MKALLSEETGMKCGYVGCNPRYKYRDHPLRNLLALCDYINDTAENEIAAMRGGGNLDTTPHITANYYEGRRNAATAIKSYILKHDSVELSEDPSV